MNPNPESKTRQFRFAPFALAIVCFALPFVEVSCQNQKFDTLNGFNLALGKTYERTDTLSGQTRTERMEGGLPFKLALGCVLGAVVLCFLPSVFGKLATAGIGVAGLIALWVGKGKFESYLGAKGEGLFRCEWGMGFFAATFLLLVGAMVAGFQAWQDAQSGPTRTDT